MGERIHADEPDTSESVVRALLAAECPQWATNPIDYLRTSGTDNAMWRLRRKNDTDLVVRLPRRPGAARGVLAELSMLERIGRSAVAALVRTPTVRHVGDPQDVFPHHWSVLTWIDGSDAWTARHELPAGRLTDLATDLARVVNALTQVPAADVPVRQPGDRGGPLRPLLDRLDRWLTDPTWQAKALIDVPAVRRLAAEADEVADEPVEIGLVHGDLIPGNLLVDRGRLTAVLDWGGAGRGDTAQDLAPAWSILTAAERSVFREITGADEAAWLRARAFELEHAVGGVLYYRPRQHPLGDVMARTLERILTDT